MIRALRFGLAAAAATGVHGSRVLLASWRRRPDVPGGVYDQAAFGWSERLLRAGKVTVRVQGPGELPTGPVVYIANHVSMLDIPVLVTALPQVPKFVMKKELLRVPLFGAAARAAGHIAIDRKNRGAAFAAYDEAARLIRGGRQALVFAEGTRSRSGRLMPFKKGPFVLAIAAQVPVVPIAVTGSFELMPRLSPSPRPGVVVLHVGHPILTTGLDYEDRDALSRQVREALVALGARE